jgi:endonuclease YncB( thermonuclease family)
MRLRLALLIALAVIIAGCTTIAPGSSREPAYVSTVVDGDTLRLADGRTVRLLDINTPERGQPYHGAATERLRALVANRTVQLEQGPVNSGQYGRLLRYVHVNGTLVNAELVRDGLATPYYVEERGKHRGEIDQAMQDAREQGRGIWTSAPTADCITIDRFQWDPPGNDNRQLHAEYVTFRNTCNTPIEMAEWIMTDAGTSRYSFTAATLESGRTITLHTGQGTKNRTDRYWGRTDRAVWNNDGDQLYLRNADGKMVLYRAYSGD